MATNPLHGHMPASIRILPHDRTIDDVSEAELTNDSPTPDLDDVPVPPSGLVHGVEINDEEPDTGALLDKIIDTRAWPAGAKVGDGTAGPGRPKQFSIDERIVYAMALVGGTLVEIAAHFECSETLIRKSYGPLIAKARASRKVRLRQKQYQVALEGNVGMLIWLGKQELGQVDERTVKLGDLSRFSTEELEQIAAGKIPGQLTSGEKKDESDD